MPISDLACPNIARQARAPATLSKCFLQDGGERRVAAWWCSRGCRRGSTRALGNRVGGRGSGLPASKPEWVRDCNASTVTLSGPEPGFFLVLGMLRRCSWNANSKTEGSFICFSERSEARRLSISSIAKTTRVPASAPRTREAVRLRRRAASGNRRIFGPPKDREMALAVLREAVALGVNHIDTTFTVRISPIRYPRGLAPLSG